VVRGDTNSKPRFSSKKNDGSSPRGGQLRFVGAWSSDAKGSSPAAAGAHFKSTHWSVVRKASNPDSAEMRYAAEPVDDASAEKIDDEIRYRFAALGS
jgi:hypothetical protein